MPARKKLVITPEVWRRCARKAKFIHERRAQRVAAYRSALNGIDLYVYKCKLCKQFHLTKRKPG